MLSPSLVASIKATSHEERDEQFRNALWRVLSSVEKLQLLIEVPGWFASHGAKDDDHLVRYWSIRAAGHQRRDCATYDAVQSLRADPSPLVSRRAAIWSFDDVPTAHPAAIAAFLSGCSWSDARFLPGLLDKLVGDGSPDWPRVQATLTAFFTAPHVERELRSHGPHNSFLVGPAVEALEYCKRLMLRFPYQLSTTLGVGLPLGFHSFELLRGWDAFPGRVLHTIVWAHPGPCVESTVMHTLRSQTLSDPKLVALRDELLKLDESWEFETNRWAAPAPEPESGGS